MKLELFWTFLSLTVVVLIEKFLGVRSMSLAQQESLARQPNNRQKIPKILHHIFLGTADFGPPLSDAQRKRWDKCVKTCIDYSADFKHILWNNSMVLDMLHKYYPSHVENYQSYSYGVQRADAARYFILHKFGGIYIDMDIGCRAPLRDVFKFVEDQNAHVALPENGWSGLTNDLLISTPHHPFFARTISSLASYNLNYGLPYVTVMRSTGPGFMTNIYNQYIEQVSWTGAPTDVIILSADLSHHNGKFFFHTQGSSWHAADGRIIRYCYSNFKSLLLLTLIVILVVLYVNRGRVMKRRRSLTIQHKTFT